MKKNFIGLIWGETSYNISSILYSSVITAFLLQLGINNTQIGFIWSLVLFSQMIFDYPTGSFADKYGRLRIFTIGMIFMGIATIIIAKSYNVLMLYISGILLGLGESQVSGTLFPWFVNSISIKNNKEKQEYIFKINAQSQFLTNIIGVLTGFIISFFNIDYKTLLIISGMLYIVNGVFIYFSFEDNKSTETDLVKIGKKSLLFFIKERKLWIYTLALTSSYSFYSIYLFIWQPVGKSLGITGSRLGSVYSLYLISFAISAFISKRNIKEFVYILCTSLIPVSLIVIYCSHNLILYLVGIVSLGFNYKMAMLKIMGTVHNFISNEVRSSVISLVSSLSSVFLIGLQIIIGKILDTKNLFYLQILCIFIGIIYIICILLIQKWMHEENSR
ncbi:MFS transporter [Fusobacterium pseudoperiodonticum]|mgnify:FL=1|jgi:Major Facilitator Superfamily.|uniref:MFS transporter n=1 Tax=Fusobacterium pseudoperiodonticum TaxID=2663009 RepID=UPI0028E3C708|nr:MFS transporter [Fusobacterium pseudoperiodonticum]